MELIRTAGLLPTYIFFLKGLTIDQLVMVYTFRDRVTCLLTLGQILVENIFLDILYYYFPLNRIIYLIGTAMYEQGPRSRRHHFTVKINQRNHGFIMSSIHTYRVSQKKRPFVFDRP